MYEIKSHLYADHNSLHYLLTHKDYDFYYELVYHSNNANIVVDALSRKEIKEKRWLSV